VGAGELRSHRLRAPNLAFIRFAADWRSTDLKRAAGPIYEANQPTPASSASRVAGKRVGIAKHVAFRDVRLSFTLACAYARVA
jgi:hypothetical protein